MARTNLAWLVAIPSAVWFYHDVAIAAAKKPVGWFPILPAIITAGAVMMALYWMSKDSDA